MCNYIVKEQNKGSHLKTVQASHTLNITAPGPHGLVCVLMVCERHHVEKPLHSFFF